MIRTKSGLPKHCAYAVDRHGKRRVRFRRRGFSTYLSGTPWSEEFMRAYATALDGVAAQVSNIGEARTIPGTINALVKAYLDPQSSSPFKTLAAETRRTRRNILERFAAAHGDKPIFRTDNAGRRTMLLTREHMQRMDQREDGNAVRTAQFSQHAAGDVRVGLRRRPGARQSDARRDPREGQDQRLQDMVRGSHWSLRGRASDRHEGAAGFRVVALHRPASR